MVLDVNSKSSIIAGSELKSKLRQGLDSDAQRASIWPILPSIANNIATIRIKDLIDQTDVAADNLYKAAIQSMQSTQSNVLTKVVSSFDSKIFVGTVDNRFLDDATKHIITLLKQIREDGNSIENTEGVTAILRIILNVTASIQTSHLLIREIISNKDNRYVSFDKVGLTIVYNTFKEIVKDFMPKTFAQLIKINALEDRFLQLIFVDFFLELLPAEYVYTIVDSYLYEGVKILYRYGIALLRGFKSKIKSNVYSSGEHFWMSVKATALNNGKSLLLKSLFLQEKLPGVASNVKSSDFSIEYSRSYESLSSLAFEKGISASFQMKRSLGVRVSKNFLESIKAKTKSKPIDVSYSDLSVETEIYFPSSDILNTLYKQEKLSVIFKDLGLYKQGEMGALMNAYSSATHGRDLSTLYKRITGKQPIIVLIQLLHPYSHILVGAYVESQLVDSNSLGDTTTERGVIRGDHLTFIFRVDLDSDEDDSVSLASKKLTLCKWTCNHDDRMDDTNRSKLAALSQYAVTAKSSLSFGASYDYGTNAIRLSQDLNSVSFGCSDTFNNDKPLVLSSISQSTTRSDYEVAEVEVFYSAF